VRILVTGKGGAGKTTVAGTLARHLARVGHEVVAVDCDANPMLGISLGLGAERTEALIGARQALDAGEAEHQPTVERMLDAFGDIGPDGVRLVVASRLDRVDPG
jgi:CO dehydrogenase maturation factor